MKLYGSYIMWILLLLVSCDNEDILQTYEAPVPIRFSSQCIDVCTKSGAITGNMLPQNTLISLFSLQHLPQVAAEVWSPDLFDNTTGRADINGNILYDNTYYFPVNKQIDFFAIHPSLDELGCTYTGKEQAVITLKENVAEQSDLMYAALLNQSKKSPTLLFEFNHLLTQISFHILKGPSVVVDLPLTKIEIIAPQKGTLDLWTGTLTTQVTPTATYTLQTYTTIENETVVPGQFLLFPEKALDFVLTFGTGTTHVYHVIPAENPSTWEAGKNYQYNITINKDITDQAVNQANAVRTRSSAYIAPNIHRPDTSARHRDVPPVSSRMQHTIYIDLSLDQTK